MWRGELSFLLYHAPVCVNQSLHGWQSEGRWHDRTLEQDLSTAGSLSSRSVFAGERRASLSLRWYSQHVCWSRQLLAAVSKESPIILISPQRRRQTSHRNISRCRALLNIKGVLYIRCSGEMDILVSRMLLVYLLYWHTQILIDKACHFSSPNGPMNMKVWGFNWLF